MNSLYITVCLLGTLHGTSHNICKEVQHPVPGLSIEECSRHRKDLADPFLRQLRVVMPSAEITMPALRCAPSVTDEGDDL